MTQNEKEDGSKNEDPGRNQNPMTLLGSQKSLHQVQNSDQNSDDHFQLKNIGQKQESKEFYA